MNCEKIKILYQKPMIRKAVFAGLCVLILLLSFGVKSIPLLKKREVIVNDHTQMVLARNMALGLGYKMETKDGVVLSSSLVSDRAMPAPNPYWGTSLIYSWLFEIFGFSGNLVLPIIVSLLTHALVTVLFFILIKRLFNYPIAAIFTLFEIFLPIIIHSSLMVEFYEFASLFFTIGLLFYFFKKDRTGSLGLFFTGFFFTLAVITRNAFLFSYGAFVLYEFYRSRSFKRVLWFILPAIILAIAAIFYALPRNYGMGYIGGMIGKNSPSFQVYGHIFPDPFTFNYDQDGYFKSGGQLADYSEPFLSFGRSYSLKKLFSVYLTLTVRYVYGFFDLLAWGGPLIIFLSVVGFIYLYKEDRKLFKLFILWLGIWFFSYAILTRTDNWTHYIELEFLMVLSISLGLFLLLKFLYDNSYFIQRVKYVLISLIFIFLIMHLVQANRWMSHEGYTGDLEQTMESVGKYVNSKKLSDKDVIAVGISGRMPYALNYYTDLNYVYFDSSTLERLLSENRLKEAFTKYNVDKILGYAPELSEKVVKATEVENLAGHIHIQEEKNVIIYPDKTLENSL